MTDLTPSLNELLKSLDSRPTADPTLTLQNIDEFLKEAYRIVRLQAFSPCIYTDKL
jgi:syntaxin 18